MTNDQSWHGGPFIKGGTHQSLVWKVMEKSREASREANGWLFSKKKSQDFLRFSPWFIPPCKKNNQPVEGWIFFPAQKPTIKNLPRFLSKELSLIRFQNFSWLSQGMLIFNTGILPRRSNRLAKLKLMHPLPFQNKGVPSDQVAKWDPNLFRCMISSLLDWGVTFHSCQSKPLILIYMIIFDL